MSITSLLTISWNINIMLLLRMIWELNNEEGRMWKNWCLRTMVPEKTPESSLESKEIKPVNLKEDKPWIFTRRTDAEAEVPVFWSSDVSRQLTGKVPDAGKIEGRRRRGHQKMRWLDGIKEMPNSGRWWGTGRPGVLQSMGSQRDMTGQLNNNNNTDSYGDNYTLYFFKNVNTHVSTLL